MVEMPPPVDLPSERQAMGETTIHLARLLERANQIAVTTHLGTLLDQTLELILDICCSRGGMIFLQEKPTGHLVFKVARGDIPSLAVDQRMPLDRGTLGAAFRLHLPTLVGSLVEDLLWQEMPDELRSIQAQTALCLPLMSGIESIGVVLLLDHQIFEWETLQLVLNRLSSDIYKTVELEAERQRGERLGTLINMFGRIGSTLDRDQILQMMLKYAREVINAEASSLFLVDEKQGDITLHLANNVNAELSLDQVRVPAGKGIIGHVIESGKTVLVPDVSRDERHYGSVDQAIGFNTRAILAVPLSTREVILGGERGIIKQRVIGGFEAVNKILGTFDGEDAQVLETLANQAATVLEIATLYSESTQLFMDVIQALAAAIDAKDPYTEGHSQRVSDFAVEMGRELNMPPEMIHRLRIGSLLHDVGKIGIPDSILAKPDKLTETEYEIMKNHPAIGARIMGQVRMLHAELPAMAEHHERLDGQGYPTGLKGEQISLFGRIVAVADVFDALTSNRPYRKSQSAEETLDLISQGIDSEYDRQCVEALQRAYVRGGILTQQQREVYRRSVKEKNAEEKLG